MSNMVFPQAGIITSLDVPQGKAKVFLPLYKIETSWIPISTNMLYEEKLQGNELVANGLERDAHTVYEDPAKTTVKASATGPKATASKEKIDNQTIEKLEYGTLKVGDEVVVVFINGNLNDGRVIARI